MASTLAISYHDIAKRVAVFLGYGRVSTWNDADWSTDDLQDIWDAIDSGLRQFYYPPAVYNQSNGRMESHDWSFLKPVKSVTTTADTGDYSAHLPGDLVRIIGDFTFAEDSNYPSVSQVGEGWIRAKRARVSRTARPEYYALRPMVMTGKGTGRQGWTLMFYPTPDDAYVLEYQYEVQPGNIRDSRPYPYGGEVFGEVILESCLSAAETQMNDDRGVHHQKFLELLSPAVEKDKQMSRIRNLGYNGNPGGAIEEFKRTKYVYYQPYSTNIEDY